MISQNGVEFAEHLRGGPATDRPLQNLGAVSRRAAERGQRVVFRVAEPREHRLREEAREEAEPQVTRGRELAFFLAESVAKPPREWRERGLRQRVPGAVREARGVIDGGGHESPMERALDFPFVAGFVRAAADRRERLDVKEPEMLAAEHDELEIDPPDLVLVRDVFGREQITNRAAWVTARALPPGAVHECFGLLGQTSLARRTVSDLLACAKCMQKIGRALAQPGVVGREREHVLDVLLAAGKPPRTSIDARRNEVNLCRLAWALRRRERERLRDPRIDEPPIAEAKREARGLERLIHVAGRGGILASEDLPGRAYPSFAPLVDRHDARRYVERSPA